MKIEKLRLKGFTGIQKGLGLEEIEIDFANISGLVAFDGQNGLGKSTILENLHPYNTLASRSGALYQHVYTRKAEKELSFTYQGNHYRTLLKIDCQSGKSEGFIWKNGNSEVNGKITAYAKYINALLGSEKMFFASVFCAQNSAKLSDMTAGELKSLLAEFLNLDKLAEYEANAKDKITAVSGSVEQADRQLLILNNKLAGFDEIGGKLETARGDLIVYERDNDLLKKRRVEYQADLELLRDKKSKQEVLISQKANIEAKIKELEEQLGKELSANDSELATLRASYRGFQEEIKKNEELLKLADEINAAADRETEIQATIDHRSEIMDLRTKDASEYQYQINELTADRNTIQNAIKDFERDIRDLNNDDTISVMVHLIGNAKNKADILGKRDQDCQSSTCSFIVDALKAKEELPGLEAKYEEKLNSLSAKKESINKLLEENKAKLPALNQKIADATTLYRNMDILLSDDRKQLATLRFDLGKVKDLAGKKTALAVAQTQYDNVTRQMEENAAKGKELKIKWEQRKGDLDGSINDAKASLSDIEKQIDNSISEQMDKIDAAYLSAGKQMDELQVKLNDTRAMIMKYEADLSARAEVEKDIAAANVEKAKLQQDISDWTYLRNACGKNGLQAMEIDGAAPIITGFANDLLTQAFGPIFTVKLRTINEEGKECLDIIVINEDGEEILLDNLSGGQRVWVLMALRLGMTLLSKEKSGHAFESFYADELDGALDPENANNFVNMYRAFMASGNFGEGYFISHKPSCRSLADNILMFEKNKSPYFQ